MKQMFKCRLYFYIYIMLSMEKLNVKQTKKKSKLKWTPQKTCRRFICVVFFLRRVTCSSVSTPLTKQSETQLSISVPARLHTWETFTGSLNSPSSCQCFNFTVRSLHHWADTGGKNGCEGMTEAEKRQRQPKSTKRKKLFLFIYFIFYIRKECARIHDLPGERRVFVNSLNKEEAISYVSQS